MTVVVSSAQGDENERRFFDGLRSRRLFQLAEKHCEDELSNTSLPDDRRTELTLELSRTLVEHAQFATDDQQPELWQQASTVLDELLATGNASDTQLLQVQRALVAARRCEFLRAQCDLFPADRNARNGGLTAGQDAVRRLQQVEKQLSGQADRDAESRQLLRNVQLQLGLVTAQIAQLLPATSPARAEQLINADQWLKPLARRTSTNSSAWNARIGIAVVSRLRGDIGKASREVAALMADQPTTRDVADRIAVEHVRLLLIENQPTDAVKFFIGYRRKQKRLSGELHLLKIKALMQVRGIAVQHDSKSLIPQLDEQLNNAIRNVDLEVGGYWSARCRVLVNRLNESNTLGPEVAELMQQARAQFLAGDRQQAASGYLKAAAAAATNGDAKSAADFRFTAASILLKANDHARAAEAFGLFARSHSLDERSAKAHLLHAWCLGQLYNSQRTSTTRKAYTAALISHREQFAKNETFGDATWMLGQLEEQRLQATKALELYRQIPADHQYAKAATLGIARAYEKIFARLAKLNFAADQILQWQQKAARDLQSISDRFPSDQLSTEQAEAIAAAAGVFLGFPKPDYQTADDWLQRAITSVQSAPPGENSTERKARVAVLTNATRSRIISLAGLKKLPEAGRLINQLANDDAASFVSVVDGLSKLAERQTDAIAFVLGLRHLRAIDLLEKRATHDSEIDINRIQRLRISALMTTGDYRKAINILQPLADADPRDETILTQLAVAHEGTARTESFQKSYELWKKMESLHKPGTADWCAARYNVARMGLKLNKVDETTKLVKVTRLLYPNLGTPEIREKFGQLEKQLRR